MSPENGPNYPVKALRPEELLATKAETFPEEVFIAVNGLLIEQLEGQYARITLKALRNRMEELGLNKDEIVKRGWYKVGAVYQQAGWDVTLRYPGQDDRDFDPYYYFNTKGARSW